MASRSVMTVAEAAKYLRTHPSTLRRFARQGIVPAVKLGGTWRFRREDLDQWLHGQSSQPVAQAVEQQERDRDTQPPLRPENVALLELIDEWVANPPPVDEEQWREFERVLAENPFRLRGGGT